MINKAFFSITDENVLKYIQNDFILSNYQSYLSPENAMYVVDDTRAYLSDFMYIRAQVHADLDSKLKIARYDQYKILKLTTDDLSALVRWITNGRIYNGIADEIAPESVTKRIIDAQMCETLLELMKNGATIFYREYDTDIYEESDTEPLKDKLLRYIAIDTRVDPNSESIPSNPTTRSMITMLYNELTNLGFEPSQYIGRDGEDDPYYPCGLYVDIDATTSKEIPIIGFVAHIDSHNLFTDKPSPYIIKLLDQYYNETGVNLFDKPYTQAELNTWYKEGVIVSSKGGLGVNGKAGVAELMGVIEYLKAHPEIPHGHLMFYFATDAELNRSMNYIDHTTFRLCDMAFFLDGSGLNEISYSNFNTYYMELYFSGTSNENAIKNACELVNEILHGTNASNVGDVKINSLNGDSSYAKLQLEIKDLDADAVTDKIDWIVRTLNNTSLFSPATVTYNNHKLYGNIQSKIPSSMLSLASEANYNIFNRAVIGTVINNATNVTTLVSKGIPSIVLSNGVYNPYTEHECIPIPSLTRCRDVVIEIIKLSYDASFTDLTT